MHGPLKKRDAYAVGIQGQRSQSCNVIRSRQSPRDSVLTSTDSYTPTHSRRQRNQHDTLTTATHPPVSELIRCIDNYIKYSLDLLRPIRTAEAFEAVDWLADLP